MESKSNKRGVRFPEFGQRYVTQSGEVLKFPVLPGNNIRVSGRRTGKDEEFLAPNKGKLQILQQKMA